MAGKGKPKTGGRKKGTPNKVLHCIKEVARVHGNASIKVLFKMMMDTATVQNVRLGCAKELLDRGYGKPIAQITHTGANDGPIITEDISMLELARRSAFLLVMADREKDAAELESRTIPGEVVNLTDPDNSPSKPNGHELAPDVNLTGPEQADV